MSAFCDATCEKCKRRIGWQGKVTDHPPCPKCGHKPDPAKLAADQKLMDEFEELLRTRPNKSVCRKQRVAAGLSLRQAAKELGIEPKLLADIENGRTELSAELARKMGKTYDVGETDDATV